MCRLLVLSLSVCLATGCSSPEGSNSPFISRSADCELGYCGPMKNHCHDGYWRGYDDFLQKRRARACACDAIGVAQSQSPEEFSDDFEDGFEQAYVDIALGGSGVTPAVPPEKYWNAYYRGPSGKLAAHDWFAGYELGSAMAQSHGVTEWRTVATSIPYAAPRPIARAGAIRRAPAIPAPSPAIPTPAPIDPAPAVPTTRIPQIQPTPTPTASEGSGPKLIEAPAELPVIQSQHTQSYSGEPAMRVAVPRSLARVHGISLGAPIAMDSEPARVLQASPTVQTLPSIASAGGFSDTSALPAQQVSSVEPAPQPEFLSLPPVAPEPVAVPLVVAPSSAGNTSYMQSGRYATGYAAPRVHRPSAPRGAGAMAPSYRAQ